MTDVITAADRFVTNHPDFSVFVVIAMLLAISIVRGQWP